MTHFPGAAPAPLPEQDYVFIADESGISNDRFIVVGGLAMHKSTMREAYRTLADFRETHNMRAELKWQRVSDQKLREYLALVDYFFFLNESGAINFHCIVFDAHQWNHKKYNDGSEDIGLSKLYFQLILHKFIRTYGEKGSLYARLDHRNSKTPLETIRRMLNNAAKSYGLSQPLKQLVSCDSRACDLLQLNDVILGAVCAARNGRHLSAGRRAKREIATRIMERSGLGTFTQDSARWQDRFTVWNMRPRPR